MNITFREAAAEVELGLVSGDQLPDIATSSLLEGYDSDALANLAGQFGEPYDPVEIDRLWSRAMQELALPSQQPLAAARILVRAYARLVVSGSCRRNSAPARSPGSTALPVILAAMRTL
jgi:hypothetical protein